MRSRSPPDNVLDHYLASLSDPERDRERERADTGEIFPEHSLLSGRDIDKDIIIGEILLIP